MALSVGLQRVIAGAAIVPASIAALPVTALTLDQHIDENLLLPLAATGTFALGASVGAALPKAFSSTGNRLVAAGIGGGSALGIAALSTATLFGIITDR